MGAGRVWEDGMGVEKVWEDGMGVKDVWGDGVGVMGVLVVMIREVLRVGIGGSISLRLRESVTDRGVLSAVTLLHFV